MSAYTGLTLRGSDLKEFILENILDKTNKKKLSVREFVITKWADIGGSSKSAGSFDYWCRHKEIIDAEPFSGRMINEKLCYDYAIEKGYWTKDEIPFDRFCSQKIKTNVSKTKVIIALCKRFKYPFSKYLSLEVQEKTIRYIYGDKDVDKFKEEFLSKIQKEVVTNGGNKRNIAI
jgi:hypothetical protein